ncbi:hypothetical protein G6F43_012857 [Rhizopus delemar]|nr:hypothetical protein G6F43_012857 [Rhizopus delemar]
METILQIDVVARGNRTKFLLPSRQLNLASSDQSKPTIETIFETEDIQHHLMAQKATSIVQQTLTPGSVIFSFPTNLFDKVTDAYKAIEQHIGEVDGFRNLSKYESRRSTQLIVVARFRKAEDSRKALSEGFVYNNMTFKATPSMVHAERSLVRLQLTLLHIPSKATFLEDLLSSLKYYGKVCQIKQRLHEGYFEGELSVLLDISSPSLDEQGIPLPIQALQRNLYLEAWDTFAQASYRGAEPVCYYCRKAGHIRAKCPLLQKQVCYGCGKNGHTRRFCKRVEDNEGDALDKYIQDTQASTVSVSNALHPKSATELQPTSPVLQTEPDLLDELCEALDTESSMDMEPDQIHKSDGPDFNRHDGTLASKYAPLEIGYAMHIDPNDQPDVQKPTILAKGSVVRTTQSHQPIGHNE